MTDYEINKKAKLKPIKEVAKKLNIKEKELIPYGNYMAKLNIKKTSNKKGKLILVTSTNPTPYGEGKTTLAIGLNDAMNRYGKKSVAVLREPSLGPVFGSKGGATGGGKSQVAPMNEINLHFTGDFHAITSANNLISAIIDNHIYFGNKLEIDKVYFTRCLDVNDRSLRKINTKLREDCFTITAASEIMAIFTLSKDLNDLKERLDNILIGKSKKGKDIYLKDLGGTGAVVALLKDAMKPNLVQSLENNPVIIHGGPFANIAHGCNSIIATNLGLSLADYVITEAGFGADLGAEKFLDIKCRNLDINPDAVVIVATIKALKYHGGITKEHILEENISGLEKGIDNLYKHIDNIKNKFGLNVIVAINKYASDTDKEIDLLRNKLKEKDVELSLVTGYTDGGNGAIDIANKLVSLVDKKENFKFIYDLNDDIKTKIKKVANNIYYAKDVEYSEEALQQIKEIETLGYGNYPICIAKTQYSLSDDPNNLECDKDYNITVRSVELKTGAGFIVVLAGKIMTMPGLPKVPAAESIDIDKDGNIVGIF